MGAQTDGYLLSLEGDTGPTSPKAGKNGIAQPYKKIHGIAQPFLNKIFDSFTNLKENMIAQQEGCSKVMSILCKPASRKAKVCENS